MKPVKRSVTPSSAGRRRPVRTLVAFLALVLVSGLLAGTSASMAGPQLPPPTLGGAEDEALVEFHLADRAAADEMIELGADLAEYVRDNPDGTITVNAFVTPSERAYFEALGYRSGVTVEDVQTWRDRKREREEAIRQEQAAHEAAEKGALPKVPDPTAPLMPRSASSQAAAEPEVTVMRADHFTNYAGRFLSVEARTSLGTSSGGPTLAMSWREQTGLYGSATTMSKFVDAGQYMYHRLLVRIGAAGSTTPVPFMVRVASNTGETAERAVETWVGGGLPPYADEYQSHFFTHYMDAVEVYDRIDSLASEFSNIAEIVDLPHDTGGYQRPAMAVMAGTTGTGSAPSSAAQPQAVVLYSKAMGHEGGNDVQAQFLHPGLPNQPLTVSVAGSQITVTLATDAAGSLSSTAAQVRDAINNHAGASALVTAYTWAGNAGAGIVQPRALANLSDFLAAPASVPRGPFEPRAIRIGKQRDGSKVGVFLFCQQHAREWVTPLVCVETAERLLRNYAIDPGTRDMVDNLDIFILPSVNPDGSLYSFYDFASQRRNMTRYCSLTASNGMPSSRNAWGVDLNRNNSEGTLFDGYSGASTSCTSDTFAGPGEVSEPEIKNEHWLVDTFSNIKFSNNIHSYGGYFMWAPGAYRTPGRITLPAPNIGIEGYFFVGADLILNRIKEYRGTVILPGRTGPVADVLYSAAGNSADDQWYRKNIIAYSFEVGADLFTSTTTGTSQSAVGFQPNFTTEGQHEAMEFAAGNYGLLETALAYSRDDEAPVTEILPNGGASQTPITATFRWVNEPSMIHYTLDGSTPTLDSPMWEAKGPRQPGRSLTFDATTTVKWIARDIKGNLSDVQTARFAIDAVAPVTTATFDPPVRNGWYRNPTITLTGDDAVDEGGAGIDVTEYRLDGGEWTVYEGPFQVTGDGPHGLQYRSVDLAGNAEEAQTLLFNVDGTKPTVAITAPASGASYRQDEAATAAYACQDALSGIERCDGTVPSGGAIDTSTPGWHTFEVTAQDVAGNEETASVQYRVSWPFQGFFKPVSNPPTVNVARSGRGIPVKFGLGGDRGLDVFEAGYPRSGAVSCATGAPESTVDETVSAGQSGLQYSDGKYVYVWKTDESWAGTCRQLVLKFVDGSERTALFRFRA